MTEITRQSELPTNRHRSPVEDMAPPDGNRLWSSGAEDFDGFSLLDIWLFLRRRQLLIATFFFALSTLGILLVMERETIYRATAKIMVAPDERQMVAGDGISGRPQVDREAVNSQVQILTSTDVVLGVVRRIGFEELLPPERTGPLGRLLAPVRDRLAEVTAGDGPPAETEAPPLPDEMGLSAEELATVARFRSMMTVRPVSNSAVVDVQFDHPDPRVASYVANQIVDYYVEALRVRRVADANEALAWARERLFEIQAELEEVRRSMAAATAPGDFPADDGSVESTPPLLDQDLIEGQLTVTLGNLSAARDDLLALQARARSAREALDQGLFLSALELSGSTSLLERLRDDEADARSAMAEARATFSSQHPDYRNAAVELSSVLGQIEAEARAFVAAMDDQVASAEQRVTLIEAEVADLTRQNLESIQAEIPLRTLEASEQVGQTLYEILRTRADLIQGEVGLARADARVISSAIPPTRPISPSRKVTLAAVVFVSLSVSLGIAAGIELTRSGFQSTGEIRRDLAVQSTGIIPLAGPSIWPQRLFWRRSLLRGKSGRGGRQSEHTIALQSLLYSIRSCAEDRSPAWTALVSGDRGEGKSVTAVTLGQMAALSGRRSLVVNGDLRRAHLAPRMLGPAPAHYVTERVIDTGRELELKLYRDHRTGLDILDIAVKDLFDIPRALEMLPDIVADLPETYGLVIVDTPAIAAFPDALIVGRLVDVVVCLVQWRRTPRHMVRYVVTQLHAIGQRSVVITLNKVRLGRYKLVNSNDSRLFRRTNLYQ